MFGESVLPYNSSPLNPNLPTMNNVNNSTIPPLLLVSSTHASKQNSQPLTTSLTQSSSSDHSTPSQSPAPLNKLHVSTVKSPHPTHIQHPMITIWKNRFPSPKNCPRSSSSSIHFKWTSFSYKSSSPPQLECCHTRGISCPPIS